MNGQEEEGFTLHCGLLTVAIALIGGGVAIFFTLGWSWLWLVPAAGVAYWLFMLVVNLFESRWLAVTPDDVRRGVPANCARCGEELLVAARKTRFETQCPICGHRGSGRF